MNNNLTSNHPNEAILIVGGYGTVGRIIASQLARRHHTLIIGGRNAVQAATFAAGLGSHVKGREIDVAQPLDYDNVFAGVRLVIMCLDSPNIEFVRQCLQRGIDYVDISAEYSILIAITALDEVAKAHGATAVVSVGLVPGLSNLMARHSLRFIHPIHRFDAALLAGLGEKHGIGGSTWILRHFSDESGRRRFYFRQPYGEKPVYRFAFSDQYTLPHTLPIANAATWLGFDSIPMTHLIGLARFPLLRPLFQQPTVRNFLLNATQSVQLGRDDFVLTTQASYNTEVYQAWLHGKNEASVTALVTAELAHRMIVQRPPAGVFHIEQLYELDDFLLMLQAHGVTFSSTSR